MKKCDYIIIECSSQGLHQGRLDGINFDYSVITNIDKDHIDYHKTLRNYIHSKLNIINQSIKVVLNHDCINLKKIDNSQYKCKQKYYISKNPINKKNFIDTDQDTEYNTEDSRSEMIRYNLLLDSYRNTSFFDTFPMYEKYKEL